MAENIVLAEMTWTEVEEALKERPVAIVPVGATEAHGPHLPVSADTVIAHEMARRGAAKLKQNGVAALILPAVAFSVAEMGEEFPGTISVSEETAVALLRDVALATAKRFRAVAFANVHLEPRHLECLKKAVDEANKGGAKACWVDIQKKRWAAQLGEAFARGDHAGAWETSLMMAAAPGVVRDSVRRNLAPLDEIDAQKRKAAKTFSEAGGEDAYFGDPTAASAEDGEAYFEALAQVLSVTVREHLGSKA